MVGLEINFRKKQCTWQLLTQKISKYEHAISNCTQCYGAKTSEKHHKNDVSDYYNDVFSLDVCNRKKQLIIKVKQ